MTIPRYAEIPTTPEQSQSDLVGTLSQTQQRRFDLRQAGKLHTKLSSKSVNLCMKEKVEETYLGSIRLQDGASWGGATQRLKQV